MVYYKLDDSEFDSILLLGPYAVDLVKNMLQKNPSDRLPMLPGKGGTFTSLTALFYDGIDGNPDEEFHNL